MIVGLLQREVLHVVDVLLHRGVGDLAWGADLWDHFGVDFSDLIQVVSVDAFELGELLRELQSKRNFCEKFSDLEAFHIFFDLNAEITLKLTAKLI